MLTILMCIVLPAAAYSTIAIQEQNRDAWEKFASDFKSPGLTVVWDEATGVPRSITGMQTAQVMKSSRPIAREAISPTVFTFLERYKGLFNIPTEAVKVKNVKDFKKKWFVTLQTYYRGIPITDGQVGFTLDTNGNILTYAADYDPRMELNTEPKISREEAVEIARKFHQPGVKLTAELKEAYLTIYREADASVEGKIKYRLTWYIFLGAKSGHLEVDRVFLIDAQSGEKIKDYYPNPFTITGVIQGETYPEHSTDAVATVPFEHEGVSVPSSSTYTDAAGQYSLSPGAGSYTLTTKLEGPYVRVQSYDSSTGTDLDITHTATVADPGTHNWTWTAGTSSPDDGDGLNIFWHANRLHDDYYQGILGINWSNYWTGTSRMNYSVNRGTIDNAFAGDPVTLFSDAISRNCDIVYHESTHNVLYDIFGGSWIGFPASYSEGYAFDEGFADYVACSFNNDSVYAENVHPTRNCDNTMLYPGTGYFIEGHTGGQLIAGVAWDLWNKEGLSHNDTDVLLFDALYHMATLPSPYYFSNPGYSNYLTSLLTADDDDANLSNGTPHDRQIFQAFRNHDMLPVDVFCKDSPLDDGNVPSSGYHWTSPDIWVRNAPDGLITHQNPIYNSPNYIYVRVRNLGYLTANTTVVKVYWADPAGGIPWPADWNYIGESTVTSLLADSETVAAAIPWTPTGTAIGHRCLLVRLESSQDMITEEGNVPYDNNIAQKNIEIVELKSGLPSLPKPIGFFLHNYPDARMDLVVEAFKVNPQGDIMKREAAGPRLPFKVELKMPKLSKYKEAPEFIYRKNAGCFFQRLFGKRENRFTLRESSGKISGIQLKKVDRALNQIRFIPTGNLEPGTTYEVTIMQVVNGEVVGGITYILRVTGK